MPHKTTLKVLLHKPSAFSVTLHAILSVCVCVEVPSRVKLTQQLVPRTRENEEKSHGRREIKVSFTSILSSALLHLTMGGTGQSTGYDCGRKILVRVELSAVPVSTSEGDRKKYDCRVVECGKFVVEGIFVFEKWRIEEFLRENVGRADYPHRLLAQPCLSDTWIAPTKARHDFENRILNVLFLFPFTGRVELFKNPFWW